jgi:hypothetical protein
MISWEIPEDFCCHPAHEPESLSWSLKSTEDFTSYWMLL